MLIAPSYATPPDVIERMLSLAGVGSGDTLYDLGCGDGRIVIAAALRGATGVGVDLDEVLVAQAQAEALRAGVAGRVRFEVADAYEIDVLPASVVVIYLLESSTPRMIAHLLGRVRSGTRIVSHTFEAGFVRPARTEVFIAADGMRRGIHLWIVD